MIVYHGSHKAGLKELEFTEDNSRFGGEESLIHGAAIYMTFNKSEAEAYATSGSVYTVEVNGDYFDATSKEVLLDFIYLVEDHFSLSESIINETNIKGLISKTLSGQTSGLIFARNLADVISDTEYLYNLIVLDELEEDIDRLYQEIEELFHWQIVKLNNSEDQVWVLCADHSGYDLEIIEETIID
jgi:hypothetical protein